MFQNALNIPKTVHNIMDFQNNQMKITKAMLKYKADHMAAQMKVKYNDCNLSKQQGQEYDKTITNLKKTIGDIEERARKRSAKYRHCHGPNQHGSNATVGYKQADMNRAFNEAQKRCATPGFSGLEVNAFDPTTPDALKQGKNLIASAVTLQAMAQGTSPGHVRSLFPQMPDTFSREDMHLIRGSSVRRIDSVIGGKSQSSF